MNKYPMEVRCMKCSKLVNVRDLHLYSGWCECDGTRGMNGKDRTVVPRGIVMIVKEERLIDGLTVLE